MDEGKPFADEIRRLGDQVISAPDYDGAMGAIEWNAFWYSFRPDQVGALQHAHAAVTADFAELGFTPDMLALAAVARLLRERSEAAENARVRAERTAYEQTPARRAKRRENRQNGPLRMRPLDADTIRAASMAIQARLSVVNEAIVDDVVKFNEACVSLPTLALMLDRHPETLRSWRKAGTGPPSRKIGGQWVYDLAEISAWFHNQPNGA